MEDPYASLEEPTRLASRSRVWQGIVVAALIGSGCGACLLLRSSDVAPTSPHVSLQNTSSLFGCSKFTDGTCKVLGCQSWRGRTTCTSTGLLNGICECEAGYCVNDFGVCVPPPGTCPKTTAGTCGFFGCHTSRGPTKCVEGKCICEEGHCDNGKGFCDRQTIGVQQCPSDTGGTCKWSGCHLTRGPVECKYNKCLCSDGTCATVAGTCGEKSACEMDTGGTCAHLPCWGGRGPTTCQDGKCLCQDGFCAVDSGNPKKRYGVCELRKGQGSKAIDRGWYRARVVPVNQNRRQFPSPHDKVKIALCISGGGARSLTWALGAYRALHKLDLLKHVDAISSVSGGTWASSIYMFSDKPLDDLLGEYIPPERLTVEDVTKDPPPLGNVVTTPGYTNFIEKNAVSRMKASDVYIDYIAQTMLDPLGIGSRTAFMAGSIDDVRRIKRDNPELEFNEFLVPRPDRPKVFVMGSMIGPPTGYEADPGNAILLDISPDYTGSPFWAGGGATTYRPSPGNDDGNLTMFVGGGFVETFAFASSAPLNGKGGDQVRIPAPKLPFSLATAVGLSSFGPSLDLSHRTGLTLGIPRAQLWPITDADGFITSKIHQLGDAGNMENSGVLAMLQRNAQQVAMWVNSPVPIALDFDFCADAGKKDAPYDGNWMKTKVDVIFSALFGSGVDNVDDGYLKHNQVFGSEHMASIMCELQNLKKAGKPLVHRLSMAVLPNTWWALIGGSTVDVIVIYAEKSSEWENKLPEATRAQIPKNYPYYGTGLKLSKPQVNLLAAQSAYGVLENEHMFRQVLCPQGLWGLNCRNR